MEHTPDLTGLTFVVLTALACGMLLVRLRQPPLVGYLLAGVLLGPTGFGLVRSEGLVAIFAHIGVLLLLFVVGMELSVRSLKYSWRIALPAVGLQTAGSLTFMFIASSLIGLSVSATVLLGFVVALSSTAVAVKMLQVIGSLRNRVGRITVAVLIAQDLAFLPMLLVVENLGAEGLNLRAILQIFLSNKEE